jgi:hypothetical protein
MKDKKRMTYLLGLADLGHDQSMTHHMICLVAGPLDLSVGGQIGERAIHPGCPNGGTRLIMIALLV